MATDEGEVDDDGAYTEYVLVGAIEDVGEPVAAGLDVVPEPEPEPELELPFTKPATGGPGKV